MRVDEPFAWSRPLGDGPVSLTEQELSEFMHHLTTIGAATFQPRSNGMTSSGTALNVSVSRYSLSDPEPADLPDVLVVRDGTNVTFAAVAAVAPSEASTTAWDAIFTEAQQRLGHSETAIEWTAVIGVLPDIEVVGPALAEPATVGELELHPCSEPYLEYDNSAPFSYARLGVGGQLAHSWPVVVRGFANGYTWRGSADELAATQLAALCGLLTLTFDVHWAVRESPLPRDVIDRLKPEWTVRPGPAQEHRDHDDSELRRTDYRVPAWAQEVWPRLTNGAFEPIAMHREGIALVSEHPSFALIAFVSAIESVAIATKGASRCNECRQVTGSSARFREAIARVLDEEQVEILSGSYDRRSRTAHASKLYGEEGQRGIHLVGVPFGPNDRMTFRWATLRLARRASRLLLFDMLDVPTDTNDREHANG